jgi:hypothetical protein
MLANLNDELKKKTIRLNRKTTLQTFINETKKKKKYNPHSLIHTKLELPILYSNLIIIEDMKFENSNYFINANGFLSNNIKVDFFLTYSSPH